MQVAGEDFLAGARLAADQHGGLGLRDLFGAADGCGHDGIAHHQSVAFAGGGFEDGGDQVGVGWQRQEFARAVADRPHRRCRIVRRAARHHRHGDMLCRQCAHHAADVVRDVAQHEVDARIGAQVGQCSVGIIRLIELGPPRDGNPRGLPEFARQRADDQDAHSG